MPRKTSHFGCLGCKRSKVKCDEGKPKCGRCVGQRIECEYSSEWRNIRRHDLGHINNRDALWEVELMHNWSCHTSHTIATGGFLDLFQETLPEIGFQHRYLLDAIFLLTAAHMNYKHPDDPRAAECIDRFKYSIITSLRSRLSTGVTRHNGEAVFAASCLLAIYSMICDTQGEFTGVSEAWMPLFQGSQQIYQEMRRYREETCFSSLHQHALKHPLPDGKAYLQNYDRIFELQREGHETYQPVVERLSKLAELVMGRKSGDNCLIYIVSWIMRLPKEFVGLVDGFDPCALMLMANFFQVLSFIQDSWLFKEYAQMHRQRICQRVPEEWHRFLVTTPTEMKVE